jgi:hypothetical protein
MYYKIFCSFNKKILELKKNKIYSVLVFVQFPVWY